MGPEACKVYSPLPRSRASTPADVTEPAIGQRHRSCSASSYGQVSEAFKIRSEEDVDELERARTEVDGAQVGEAARHWQP